MNKKRYNFYKNPKQKALYVLKIMAAILVPLLIILLISSFFIFDWFPNENKETIDKELLSGDYETLFSEKKYDKVIEITGELLQKDPLDKNVLIIDGIANFYYAITLDSFEDQLNYLNQAAISLRKIRVLDENRLSGKIDYFLGRIYYIKGTFYLGESIYYFLSALELGYEEHKNEIYYFLGMAYSRIGMFEESLNSLKNVEGDSEVSNLLIAITYFNKKDYSLAIEKLDFIKSQTTDEKVIVNCNFWKAKAYLEQNKYNEAIRLYNDILSEIESPDAHYHLGLVYKKMNNIIQARAEWRKAIKLQPTHMGALMELNN